MSAKRLRIAYCVAVLNEAETIDACIRSLRDQHYPSDAISICVADGGSTDGTQDIVRAHASEDPRVQLLENPAGIAAGGFNAGIAAAEADVYTIVSAHSQVARDYSNRLSNAFSRSGAMLVGGRMRATPKPTLMAAAIALATSSPVGVGGARFHYSDTPGWVDTAFPGAYRRELLDEIGCFDESLVRNQDDDLHFRAKTAGHRMWYDPDLVTDYVPRGDLRGLWRQYHDYGFWRAHTVVKHRAVASWRHMVPPMFVLGLVGGAILTRRLRALRAPYWVVLLGYSSALGAVAVRAADTTQMRVRVMVAIGAMHVAYGAGFWRGCWSVIRR